MTMGERIEERLHAKGWSQAELARRIGVQSTSIWKLVTGASQGSKHLHRIARELDTTAEYLTGETDDPAPGNGGERRTLWSGPAIEDEDRVEIASVDLAYGMGGTFLDAGEAEVEKVPFSRTWLRANVTDAPPEVLGVAQGIGDSMEPVLFDRDLVFFDRSARLQDHVSDKMWVFAYGQIGMIKRLRPLPDGNVRIMSANRTYPDEIASELHIIGRVVASLRRH